MDTMLHIVLGALLLPAVYALMTFAPAWISAATLIAIMLYWHEATQEQTKRYDSDIRMGWAFWHWSMSKNVETWVPVCVVYLLSYLTI